MLTRFAIVLGLAATTLCACGSGPEFDDPEIPDLRGSYIYSEHLSGNIDGRWVSCDGRGSLTIEQSGARPKGTISSTGHCSSGLGPISGQLAGHWSAER